MARAATTTKKKNVVRADFSDVDTQSVLPEGEYVCEIVKGVLEEGDKGDYISWEMKVLEGKHEGKTLYNNTSLAKQALWNTKRFLEAAGIAVPKGEFDIDLDEVAGLKIGCVVEHDTYKGRTKSKVIDVFPAEGETEAEEPAEENEVPTDDDIDGMGKADLKEVVEKFGLKVELEGTTSSLRRAVKKAIAEKGSKKEEKKSTKKVQYESTDLATMSEEELQELVEKHELDVNLADHPNVRRKRAAVTDALEDAGMIKDD